MGSGLSFIERIKEGLKYTMKDGACRLIEWVESIFVCGILYQQDPLVSHSYKSDLIKYLQQFPIPLQHKIMIR